MVNSWFSSAQLLLAASGAALVIAWLIGQLSPMVVLAAVLGANANQVHKWSHQTRAENGPLVTAAQRLGLLQSPRHHHGHHTGHQDSHYCVMTGLLNPVLDGSGFWRGLEWGLARLGLEKRDDERMLAAVLVDEPDFLTRGAAAAPAAADGP